MSHDAPIPSTAQSCPVGIRPGILRSDRPARKASGAAGRVDVSTDHECSARSDPPLSLRRTPLVLGLCYGRPARASGLTMEARYQCQITMRHCPCPPFSTTCPGSTSAASSLSSCSWSFSLARLASCTAPALVPSTSSPLRASTSRGFAGSRSLAPAGDALPPIPLPGLARASRSVVRGNCTDLPRLRDALLPASSSDALPSASESVLRELERFMADLRRSGRGIPRVRLLSRLAAAPPAGTEAAPQGRAASPSSPVPCSRCLRDDDASFLFSFPFVPAVSGPSDALVRTEACPGCGAAPGSRSDAWGMCGNVSACMLGGEAVRALLVSTSGRGVSVPEFSLSLSTSGSLSAPSGSVEAFRCVRAVVKLCMPVEREP